MRLASILIFAALILPLAWAAPNGPSYPPEGGVSVTPTGNIGRAGGLTWTYSGIDMDLFNGIWWGPWSGDALAFAMDGAVDSAGETLVYDFGSNNAGGIAQFLGSTKVRHFVSGAWTTETVATRLTLKATLPDATPIPFADPTSVAIDGDVGAVIAVPGDYRMNVLIEAKRGATWSPAIDLFDSLHTDPACTSCIRISVGFGFYTDLNQPPVAAFGWDDPVVERKEVTFTSTSSDPEGRAITQAWDLDGDGAYDDATGSSASTTFHEPGVYTVGLQVTDDRGLTATSVQEVTVVDCSRGPVSGALRNVVYPVVQNIAGNTVFLVACTLAEDHGV